MLKVPLNGVAQRQHHLFQPTILSLNRALRVHFSTQHPADPIASYHNLLIDISNQDYILPKNPTTGDIDVSQAAEIIRTHGFVIIPSLYTGHALEALATTFISKTDQTLMDLQDKIQHHHQEGFKVGSKNGYHEICLRSPGRYDVSSDFAEFKSNDTSLEPIENIVAQVLGPDFTPAFCGVVYSEPGSEAQQWHADSLHVESDHREANLLNGLVALHDISMDMGPTEFSPMSHLLTNHMTNPEVNGVNIVYQTPENLNRPELVGAEKTANVCLPLPAGSVVLFDDRILHRGRGNESDTPRYVGYFSYRRPWFEATTHFEATRSLYNKDGTTTTSTNDHNHLLDLGQAVRSEFPALDDHSNAVFADGAGGSQVHTKVIEAVSNHMRTGAANLGGNYSTSENCMKATRAAREAMGDLLNCKTTEIVFGHNTTSLVYHLAHSLFAQHPSRSDLTDPNEAGYAELGYRVSPGTEQQKTPWIGPGSNIVLSSVEHDTNCGPWERLARDVVGGCEVRWIPPTQNGECHLDLDIANTLIDANTKFVAIGAACNSVGTVHNVSKICQMAKNVGALSFIDAVHYAPHDLIDVQKIQCDFLACSPYKFYGPHSGVLYGKSTALEGNESILPFKIRTSEAALASDDSYQLSMWELGTQNFEALAGVEQCVEYIASIGERYGTRGGDAAIVAAPGTSSATSASSARRQNIVKGWRVVRDHENRLKTSFITGAEKIPGLHIYGVTDLNRLHERTATFAVSVDGLHPEMLCKQLTDANIYCTSGNHYCTFWDEQFRDQGLNGTDGVTRIGFLHYNTMEDVDRVLGTLENIVSK